MTKGLEICHSSLIKEIKNNSSEYGYDAKLAQKNITLELLKTTLNLNLKFINLKNLKKNSKKFITPKKWQLKALLNLSS
ncbi:hypothetical protein [Mycoplasmopsis synoviae]|uniref:hypothetical protein n=1 Tax=Mycoplasmopsis synoviae TaxID=2109 RepID=UPI001CE080BC|nr:hypothetical protein [Mycoplasmopsis synoviae]UBX99722.1 hypothetical protein K6988_00020 [Mycoplasmopsis synoviae]UBY00363.1 hypothetical protein K6990_01610 [Mycoplasmopsis synoviae]